MATIYGTNTKGLGYLVRDMNAEELAVHDATERGEIRDEVDEAIARAEPPVVRSQFRRAVERLEDLLEKRLAEEGPQGGRALLEKMALIAGDRRTKAVQVEVDRRRS